MTTLKSEIEEIERQRREIQQITKDIMNIYKGLD